MKMETENAADVVRRLDCLNFVASGSGVLDAATFLHFKYVMLKSFRFIIYCFSCHGCTFKMMRILRVMTSGFTSNNNCSLN